MTSAFEYDYIDKLTTSYHGAKRTTLPTVYQNGIVFLSDGTGGLILDHLYLNTLSGLFDLTAAGSSTITGGLNIGDEEEIYAGISGSLLLFKTLVAGNNISLFSYPDRISISAFIDPGFEVMSTLTPANLNPLLETSELQIDSIGTTVVTLPNQTVPGFKKIIYVGRKTADGAIQVLIDLIGGTSLTFDKETQGVFLVSSDSGKWAVVSGGTHLI